MVNLLKSYIRKVLPYSIRKRIFYIKRLSNLDNGKNNRNRLEQIKRTEKVKVLFIASTLSMWRYQGVYDVCSKDSRFSLYVVICPFQRFKGEEAQRQVQVLRDFFRLKGIESPSTLDDGFDVENWLKNINPDIIFYCQQYDNFYGNALDFERNLDRLWGQIPYALLTVNQQFAYNSTFQNLAWRIYQATPLHFKTAKRIMSNDARNLRIVGEPHADDYLSTCRKDPWKKIGDGKKRKRIIWAPHFQIGENGLLHRASFNWMNEMMIEVAKRYADSVQIAFKPHPNLFSVLVEKWGLEGTNKYYNLWNSMPNTQLETGEFTDLFMCSDAMIHDCGSFTGEYMFTRKPVMFMTEDINEHRKVADDFGLKCLSLHYIGYSQQDVENFIFQVVVEGKDVKKEDREFFFNEYLLPPNNRTVAENIYNDMLESFGWEKN